MALGLNLPKNGQKSLAKMAARMKEMQNQLAIIEEKEYEGIAGNKAFVETKVIVNGKLRIINTKISVSPELISKYKDQYNNNISEYFKEILGAIENLAQIVHKYKNQDNTDISKYFKEILEAIENLAQIVHKYENQHNTDICIYRAYRLSRHAIVQTACNRQIF